MKLENVEELEKQAKVIRRGVIDQVYKAGSGHPGGSLSISDIMTVLYIKRTLCTSII